MRFGLGSRIVATIVCVLAATLAIVAGGSQQFEMRFVARDIGPLPAMPGADAVSDAYRRQSWTGVERMLRSRPSGPYVILVASGGTVRASTTSELDGAVVAADGTGGILVSQKPNGGAGTHALQLRFPDVTKAPLILGRRELAETYIVPSPALLPALPNPAPDRAFRRRFYLLFLIVGAVAILVACGLAASIVRPLRNLTRAAQSASGATLPRVPARSRDELGDLARAFNALGDRLARSETARRNVISDVAHELRTPLTNVRCALESFGDGIDEPSPQALRSVLADVLLLQRLVSDLHELSVAGDAPPKLARMPADIVSEARSAIGAFKDRAAERNVRIDLSAQNAIPLVECDPARVRQVLHNLLENALRYGKRDGCIRVDVAHDPREIRVAVADDGAGFPAVEEAAIFDRFHRVDASRSRATGGTGLGLAIAKQLVEAHGGSIGANGGDGYGATVWFTLPLLASSEQ